MPWPTWGQTLVKPLVACPGRQRPPPCGLSAVRALGKIEPNAAVPAVPDLIKVFKSDDAKVRAEVAARAGPNPGPGRGPALAGRMQYDKDLEVRRVAATSLGELGGRHAMEAVPALVATMKAMNDKSKAISQSSSPEGSDPKDPSSMEDINYITAINHAASNALVSIGEGAVPELIKALGDPQAELRYDALGCLATPKAEGVLSVIPFLQDKDPATRAQAIITLCGISGPRTPAPALPRTAEAVRRPVHRDVA